MKETGKLFKSYEDVINNLTKKEFQLCDCRGPTAFSGQGNKIIYTMPCFQVCAGWSDHVQFCVFII